MLLIVEYKVISKLKNYHMLVHVCPKSSYLKFYLFIKITTKFMQNNNNNNETWCRIFMIKFKVDTLHLIYIKTRLKIETFHMFYVKSSHGLPKWLDHTINLHLMCIKVMHQMALFSWPSLSIKPHHSIM